MSFQNLGLIPSLLTAVADNGYETPTAIQTATIEAVLKGKDLMASAQTGTGKTAAFTLPLLQLLGSHSGTQPRALVVTPTRELAAQVHASIVTYGKHMDLRSLAIFGGVKIGPQIRKLQQGVDILVATPGRLLDLHNQGAVDFRKVEILVLDEADRMLDMGFLPDIRRIQGHLPTNKQSLLFSATFSNEIRKLAKTMLRSPIEVDVAAKNATADTVEQHLIPTDKSQKSELLIHLFKEHSFHGQDWNHALVFSKTKHGANKLVRNLCRAGLKADAIHGNKSQAQRTRALDDFKRGKVAILVATDIASRGLDINELPLVVNYDLPHVPEDYVHRIGRTGRAGASGLAISLVCADEFKQLREIERLIGSPLPREEIEGFEPTHLLPESKSLDRRPRPSRPRNNSVSELDSRRAKSRHSNSRRLNSGNSRNNNRGNDRSNNPNNGNTKYRPRNAA